MVVRAEPFDIPGYRIVREIGRGGMANVYLAIQLSLGRPVAIKVLAADRTPNAESIMRFEQEARTIARLDHPHIVGIFDVGRTSTGQLYYTMPHMPRGDLASRDLQQNLAAVIEVARALCHALAYAHEQGIVHRDVKPENVLFDKLNRPLLADFGIALTAAGQNRVTREGSTPGSVAYMSPEQARGHALDGRSDLYSLGVVCYECLAGKLPFSGDDSLAVALAHVEQPVPPLPPARRQWQAFLDKAMAKNADERFQTANEMLDALEALEKRIHLMAPINAMATTLAAVPQQLERRLHARSISVRTTVVAACALAALGAGLAYQFRGSTPASTTGETAPTQAQAAPQQAPAEPPAVVQRPAEADAAPQPVAAAAEQAPQAATPESDTSSFAGGTVVRDPDGPEMIVVPAEAAFGGKTYTVAKVFALGRNEVTRGEYAQFARVTGRAAASCRKPQQPWSLLERLDWRKPGFEQSDRHPVVCVSWSDANAYAQWLSQRTGQRYRLPSQAEWLHAARLQPGDAKACTRGDVADASVGSFLHLASRYKCNDGYAHTAPVGQFAPNSLGIADLLGNVSEWTRDCAPGPHCPERIFRGLSWHDGPDRGNLELSGSAKADVGYTTVGFRVVRELD